VKGAGVIDGCAFRRWTSLYTWLGFMVGGHGKGVPFPSLVVVYAVDYDDPLSSLLRAMSSELVL
jgi:hypothetical protein